MNTQKHSFWLCLMIALLLVLAACSTSTSAPAEEPSETHADTAPHWSYEGEEGPEHWGALGTAYTACAAGNQQSPIDLTAAVPEDLPNIAFHYAPSRVHILNNGHTIQVNYDPGSYMELAGVRYDLVQFHFHSQSEHAVDGTLYPLELHLVHKDAKENLAVVGVFIVEGADNKALKPVWENLPATISAETTVDTEVNAADLLPAGQTTFRYDGSLTTPPCTEGVKWSVMATPVEMSAAQIAAFANIFTANNRPLQPLNARVLQEDTSP